MRVEEVRLAWAREHVGVGVQLSQQMRRAAAGGADDQVVGQDVAGAEQVAAQASRLSLANGSLEGVRHDGTWLAAAPGRVPEVRRREAGDRGQFCRWA